MREENDMKNTKLTYEEASIEIITIPMGDVITTSLAFDGEDDEIDGKSW